MNAREQRGLQIAARLKVARDGDVWVVPSLSGQYLYRVRLEPRPGACNCADFAARRSPCEHIFAARTVQAREQSGHPAATEAGKVLDGALPWITQDLLDRTISVWQPAYAEPLTPTDALAIILNVSRLSTLFTKELS